MRNNGLEDLSAFIDGELLQGPGERLLDRLEHDGGLRAAWGRYHLIGDALARRLAGAPDPDFSRRVAGAIVREPVALPSMPRTPPGRRAVVGLAMAASVAGLAIAGIWSTGGDSGSQALAPALRGSQQAPRISSSELNPLPIATVKWNGEPTGEAVRLSPYIANHNQSNGGLQMPGVMPYVRLVTYEAGR